MLTQHQVFGVCFRGGKFHEVKFGRGPGFWLGLASIYFACAHGAVAGKETHWSLAPLARPDLPSGERHPIDAFVRAKLREKNLRPAAAAGRRELLRRLSYNLTGLPPRLEEVAAFEADLDDAAYERQADRLLASPRYGEHWARHWLDVANYADTHGNDHDYARFQAWPYRDYVIRSFNEDKPYGKFVLEQVAGDVLFPTDPEATVALGFLAAGPWDHTLMVTVREDTVDHRMSQYLDRDNMISTVMGTFQSLTVHCARCHDHKFDPISQREYYGLQAVFAGVDRADRPFDADARLHVLRQGLLAEKRALERREPGMMARLDSPEVQRRAEAWETERRKRESMWNPIEVLSVVSTGGADLERQADGSWYVSGKRPDRDTYVVVGRGRPGRVTAVRLEVMADERLPKGGPGRWDNGNFHLSEFRAFAAREGIGRGAERIIFGRALADHNEGPAIAAAQAIDGKNETYWGVDPRYGENHEAVFELKEPLEFGEGTTYTFLLENQGGAVGHGIGRFRLSTAAGSVEDSVLRPLSPALSAILKVSAAERTLEQRRELAGAVLKMDNERKLASMPPARWVYAVTRDFPPDGPNFTPPAEPRPIHLLARGDLNKPGELIGPGTLGCVSGMPGELPIADLREESLRRAALARWLADERNGLTWRSIVNRVWHYHFGKGLCETPNDFGKMGGAPSHPELLDWLAVWFRDEAGGSLKALHRLILTSETWRQTTRADHGTESDGDNRWLWRQNRQRLTGEQVRDTLLALSDQLDLTMGGPAAAQFNSRGDATFMSGGNPAFLDYEHFDPNAPAGRRRAIYRFLFRTVPDPFMDALDCPDGGAFTPVRGVSATTQQAFALLNDPFVIRRAEGVAARVARGAESASRQAEEAFRLILLREARSEEREKLAGYIERHGLANACQLLLNTNEFLYLD